MQQKYLYSKGNLRYHCDILYNFSGTSAVYLSTTACNSAMYHSFQLSNNSIGGAGSVFGTLQGTMETGVPSAGTMWFSIGTTLTAAGSGTTACFSPVQSIMTYARVRLIANTSTAQSRVIMRGQNMTA